VKEKLVGIQYTENVCDWYWWAAH